MCRNCSTTPGCGMRGWCLTRCARRGGLATSVGKGSCCPWDVFSAPGPSVDVLHWGDEGPEGAKGCFRDEKVGAQCIVLLNCAGVWGREGAVMPLLWPDRLLSRGAVWPWDVPGVPAAGVTRGASAPPRHGPGGGRVLSGGVLRPKTEARCGGPPALRPTLQCSGGDGLGPKNSHRDRPSVGRVVGTHVHASVVCAGGSLRNPIFYLLRTAPKGHQPPTANRHQPPNATNCQMPPTGNRHQPPNATNCQPPPTAKCHQPATATNRQMPPTANRHQPPNATNRQPPPTSNRQPPTPTNHQYSMLANHQPPPTATNGHQPPTANRQPPIATNHG